MQQPLRLSSALLYAILKERRNHYSLFPAFLTVPNSWKSLASHAWLFQFFKKSPAKILLRPLETLKNCKCYCSFMHFLGDMFKRHICHFSLLQKLPVLMWITWALWRCLKSNFSFLSQPVPFPVIFWPTFKNSDLSCSINSFNVYSAFFKNYIWKQDKMLFLSLNTSASFYITHLVLIAKIINLSTQHFIKNSRTEEQIIKICSSVY